jgi:type I restriction enzyme M protein
MASANGTVGTSDGNLTPTGRAFNGFSEIVSFIWSVADLLRGNYKQADYGKMILPFTVLRRLDCVLAETKAKVLAKRDAVKGGPVKNVDPIVKKFAEIDLHPARVYE